MRVVVISALVSSGCSLLLQDSLPDGLSSYSASAEPVCSTSPALPVIDTVITTLDVLGLALTLNRDSDSGLVALGVAETALFAVSSLVGFSRARDCSTAWDEWRARDLADGGRTIRTESDDERADRLAAEGERRRIAAQRRAERISEAPTAANQPRGFYCTTSASSPAAGLCAREKADCARTRDAAVVAVSDLTACTLVESAWCVTLTAGDERCFPAEDVCGAAVVRLGATATCREVQ